MNPSFLWWFCHIFLDGSLIAWKTNKHVAVSRLSAKAELRAMARMTTEVTWLGGYLRILVFLFLY
jgi:hypothetical protein